MKSYRYYFEWRKIGEGPYRYLNVKMGDRRNGKVKQEVLTAIIAIRDGFDEQ
jgi:hypothetical protein